MSSTENGFCYKKVFLFFPPSENFPTKRWYVQIKCSTDFSNHQRFKQREWKKLELESFNERKKEIGIIFTTAINNYFHPFLSPTLNAVCNYDDGDNNKGVRSQLTVDFLLLFAFLMFARNFYDQMVKGKKLKFNEWILNGRKKFFHY